MGQKPRSDLLRVITNSERTRFACKRAWWFSYIEGLHTDGAAAPLRMGSLWHECLVAWYRSGCTMTAQQIAEAVIGPWWEKRVEWHTRNHHDTDTIEEDHEARALCTGMLTGYVERFASDASDFRVLHVEPQLARWIINPKTGKRLQDRVQIGDRSELRPYAYGGAMDLLVQMPDGSVWFMEHKTTIEKDLQHYVRKLDWDPQIRGYAWAAANPINGHDSVIKEPLRITGVIYNVARKKVPVEPETLKNGSLSKARGTDTSREMFMSAIVRHGLNPDDYADVLEQLSGKVFFHREHVVFTDPELDDFGLDIAHTALRMRDEEKAPWHPRQQSICTGIAPMPCAYKTICLSDSPAARVGFSVRGIRHAELTGDLAESYVAQQRPVTTVPQSAAVVGDNAEMVVAANPAAGYVVDPFTEIE